MRTIATTAALIGCGTTVLLHLLTLRMGEHDAIGEPISSLASGSASNVHALGLLSFTVAHLALAYVLHRSDAGWLYRLGVWLIVAAGLLLLLLVPGLVPALGAASTGSTAALWLVACVIGLAMGFMVPRLWRTYRTAAWFDLACLAAWTALAPVFALVPPDLIGAYERSVAVLYTVWLAGLAWLLQHRAANSGAMPGRQSR